MTETMHIPETQTAEVPQATRGRRVGSRVSGAESVANPYDDPAGYLLARGWRATGDPRRMDTRWLDPTKPLKEESELRVIDRKRNPDGSFTEVKQLHVTPAVWPVSLDEALTTQLLREPPEKK